MSTSYFGNLDVIKRTKYLKKSIFYTVPYNSYSLHSGALRRPSAQFVGPTWRSIKIVLVSVVLSSSHAGNSSSSLGHERIVL